MPVETLTLPRSMVTAARSYAERTHKSVADLFAAALKMAYGIDCVYVVSDTTRSIRQRELSPRVKALRGCLKLSHQAAGKSYEEMKGEYLAEKYGDFR